MTNLPAKTTSPKARTRRRSRGQAMVEYSIINFLLICALVLGVTVRMVPGPHDTSGIIKRRNVIEMFLEAYQHYYNSYYFVLNLPFP